MSHDPPLIHGIDAAPRRRVLAFGLAALVTAWPGAARADGLVDDLTAFYRAHVQRLPGPARAISRTTSASRDTPVFEAAYGPKAQTSVGLEFGTLRLYDRDLSLQLGFHGMIALEDVTPGAATPFIASQLWRGVYGSSLALSSRSLAERWFGRRGAVELTVMYGHESDHADADFRDAHPEYSATPPRGLIPRGGGGDYLRTDYAVQIPLGARGELVLRVQDRLFFSGPLLHAPGADVILRVHVLPQLVPTLALFGERLFVAPESGAPDGLFGRAMLGLAFPGIIGAIMPFVSFDGGNGKGYLVNRVESHVSAGFRYAPF
jgi:hypothetical protein